MTVIHGFSCTGQTVSDMIVVSHVNGLFVEGIISDIPWQNGVEQQIQKNLFVVDNY